MKKLQTSPSGDGHSIENYKQLLEALNVVPWEFNWPKQRFLYVGPQASLFGYPADDWYAEGFMQRLVHPDDFDDAVKNCEMSWENRKDYECEFRIIRANGGFCWVRKIVNVFDGPDEQATLRGVFVDISAQKQAEEILVIQNTELRQRDTELRARNEQFNAAIDNMSQGLSMFDGDKRLIVCNARYASMYQLPPELTRPGTSVFDIMNNRIEKGLFAAAAHRNFIQECLDAISSFKTHTTVEELQNGGFLEITQVPMAAGGWVSTHDDITERKHAEKALRESQEALSIAFRLSPVSMSISSLKTGRHIEVNDAWSTMLGYSREEGLANTSLKLGIWPDKTRRKCFIRQILDDGAVRGIEVSLRTKNGCMVDGLLSGELVEVNGAQRLLIACHDITNRKKTEQELIAHRDHLQDMVDKATVELKVKAVELEKALSKERELNELQRQFVSMASHEFRTPLAIIDSTAQRLIRLTGKNSLSPENAMERFGKIRDSVQRMTRLMESVLTAAKMEEGKINVEIGPCQIGKVIEDVCSRQQEIAKHHIISCELDDIPEIVPADSRALEQVLENLLSNAEKYAPDAPDIEVKAYTEFGDVVISVYDEGVGIDADEMHRIGERFFRARTSAGTPGTGIGLNLAIKLLELHGGSLRVESRKSLGSKFSIRIPIAAPKSSGQPKIKVA